MKKFTRIIFVFLCLLLVSSINVWATSYDASLIITNPGENMEEEVSVSWHASLEGTLIKYTLASDPNFFQSQTITGECNPIPFEGKTNVLQCKATLKNLLPDHQYLYQVGKTNMSPTYSFTTAGSNNFSFIHVSDIHSYKSGINNTRVIKANNIINTLSAQSQAPEFVIATGDVTAYGTVYEQWETLLGMDSVKKMMYAITPGNHDYYNTSAQVTNINCFNSVLNNPTNGATGLTNSTYYFKYGNALFISLNSEEAANNVTHRKNQQIWLNAVIANNPADFVIVFTHRPFYTGDGKNSGQANEMKSYFQSIFDNAGVDLVLSGHNHVYARTRQVYQGNVSSKIAEGTVYITGIQIGDRYQSDNTPAMPEVDFSRLGKDADGGSIITVGDDYINMRFIDMNGNKVDSARIYSKSSSINREEFEGSVVGEIDKGFTKFNIKFKDLGIGRVKKVKISDEKGQLFQEYLNPITNEFEFNISPELENLNINAEITLRTGDVINKQFVYTNQKKIYGTVNNFIIKDNVNQDTCLYWDNEIVTSNLDHFEIYVNDVFLKEVTLNENFTTLDKVSPYHNNLIEFRTVDQKGNIIYSNFINYGEESTQLSISYDLEKINLEIGEKVTPAYTVTPSQEVNLEYHSSDESIATVNEFGEITAIGKGTCTITVNVVKRWDVKSEIDVTISIPDGSNKKGCFGNVSSIIGINLLGFIILFRKRKIF